MPEEYSIIQSAIDAAVEGDSILVQPGTYYENINFNGKNLILIGADSSNTIIDGANGLPPNGSVIFLHNGEDSTTYIANFTLTKGSGWENNGGAIVMGGHPNSDNTGPKLNNLLITENDYEAITSFGASYTLTNSKIVGNNGIGLTFRYAQNPIIENVIIRDNNTYIDYNNGYILNDGGGIGVYDNASPTFINCNISNNNSSNKGGGIYLGYATSIIISSTLITNNYAAGHGGGIFISAGSNIYLQHATIAGNRVGEGNIFGAGIYSDGGTASLMNSIVYYNRREGDYGSNYNLNGYTMDILAEYTVSYSNIEGDENWIPEGEGNISISPEVNDFENGDFTLQAGSPCIDAGDPDSELDPDGTIADMGAYYYHQEPSLCDEEIEVELWGVCYSIENTDSLSLQYNDLTGSIPPEIGNLTNLTYLSLFTNDLTGSIPPEIGNLTNLTFLSLSANDLIGDIPHEIGNLTNLEILSLGFNQFTSIPESIGNLTNLAVLYLRSNQIQIIPESIGSISNLQDLNLEYNQIQSIPESIANLTNLGVLNLSWNDIYGEIPESIGTLTNLFSLNLKKNQLSGNIPENFCNLVNILFLHLDNNNLCPPYPECIAEYVGEQDTTSCVIEDIYGCTDLHEGNNLISFSTLPLDGLDSMPECIYALAGEGMAALNTENGWVGGLTELECEKGYWAVNECDDFELCYDGIECYDPEYILQAGNNLISYPFEECGYIEEVLPSDVEECLFAIAGEGMAALNTEAGWIGGLYMLCPDDGYWFINECDDIDFTFIEPASLARKQYLSPSPYPYNQSSQQAFYFIQSVENIEIGDWILSFNGNKVIGARQWTGDIIDVPAMGDDGTDFTEGYIQTGAIPTFKVLRDGKLIDLEADIPAFANNQLYMVESMSEAIALPETFSLYGAYPNPFNPATTVTFALPENSNVLLEVYDINGRLISELEDSIMNAGYHSILWNADAHSSGVYFIRIQAGDFRSSQKLMLMK